MSAPRNLYTQDIARIIGDYRGNSLFLFSTPSAADFVNYLRTQGYNIPADQLAAFTQHYDANSSLGVDARITAALKAMRGQAYTSEGLKVRYNSDGNPIEIISGNPPNQLRTTSRPDGGRIEETLGADGRPTGRRTFNSNGQEISSSVITRDARARTETEVTTLRSGAVNRTITTSNAEGVAV